MFFILRSPLTYGMVGHLKTVSILAGGYLIFRDSFNLKQFFGILLTVFGLFFYSLVKMKEFPKTHSLSDNVQRDISTGSQMNTQDIIKTVNLNTSSILFK
jgi:hypothetical protein